MPTLQTPRAFLAALATTGCLAAHAEDVRLPSSAYVPHIEIRDGDAFEGNRSIHHDIVVVRDVNRYRDEKVILVRSTVQQRPSYAGLIWPFDEPEHEYGIALSMADAYHVWTQVVAPGLPGDQVRLVRQAPRSDGATDRTIQDKISFKTSIGIGTGVETNGPLAKDGGLSLGKLPISFTSGLEKSTERTVSMTLKDYFTDSFVTRTDYSQVAAWAFRLAPDIANDLWYSYSHYRIGPGWLYNLAKFTPMMRQAAIEVVSEWRIPGNYEGPVYIWTNSRVDSRTRNGQAGANFVERDPTSEVSHLTEVDMATPQLARQQVVRLQSLSGNGDCLTQKHTDKPEITLESCSSGDVMPEQQWYLDSDSTYRNRASGMCLAADVLGGGAVAEACDGAMLNKQWEWRADRIHSRFMDGGAWRLYVRDGKPMTIFDPVRHQNTPSNPFHALLKPWSSYPHAPTQGDVVPALVGTSPQISQGLLSYKAIGNDERWQPVPVDSSR